MIILQHTTHEAAGRNATYDWNNMPDSSCSTCMMKQPNNKPHHTRCQLDVLQHSPHDSAFIPVVVFANHESNNHRFRLHVGRAC